MWEQLLPCPVEQMGRSSCQLPPPVSHTGVPGGRSFATLLCLLIAWCWVPSSKEQHSPLPVSHAGVLTRVPHYSLCSSSGHHAQEAMHKKYHYCWGVMHKKYCYPLLDAPCPPRCSTEWQMGGRELGRNQARESLLERRLWPSELINCCPWYLTEWQGRQREASWGEPASERLFLGLWGKVSACFSHQSRVPDVWSCPGVCLTAPSPQLPTVEAEHREQPYACFSHLSSRSKKQTRVCPTAPSALPLEV